MTTALEGSEWSAVRPGRTLLPGKARYTFYRRLGGPQGRSGQTENLVSTGIRSRTVQPVVGRYTDWATRPPPTHTHTHIYIYIYIYVYYPGKTAILGRAGLYRQGRRRRGEENSTYTLYWDRSVRCSKLISFRISYRSRSLSPLHQVATFWTYPQLIPFRVHSSLSVRATGPVHRTLYLTTRRTKQNRGYALSSPCYVLYLSVYIMCAFCFGAACELQSSNVNTMM